MTQRTGKMVFDRLRRPFEPALRWVLHLHWRFSRGLTLGVRAVIVNAQGEIFLVKHSYVSGWHLPGGGVEPGETVREALAREVREEANMEIIGEPELHGLFYNARVSPRDHVVLYVVRVFRQIAAPVPGREIRAHGFFAPDALPPDATRATRARLLEIFGGAPPAAVW